MALKIIQLLSISGTLSIVAYGLFLIPLINIPFVISLFPLYEFFPEFEETGRHVGWHFFGPFPKSFYAISIHFLYFWTILFFICACFSIAKSVQSIEPWEEIPPNNEFHKELESETTSGHILHGIKTQAIARRIDRDVFLFKLHDSSGRFAVVHLTRKKKVEERLPPVEIYKDLDEWKAKRRIPDVKEWKKKNR